MNGFATLLFAVLLLYGCAQEQTSIKAKVPALPPCPTVGWPNYQCKAN